ncbi:hypothetical protein HPB48_005378 [Haemaphysalis longicornis]|uniref:Troponin I n=1 Tax=Haemaphysalis longicornis TaxID=44386 RepID=A0A9J6GFA4_HAELO|nr:hypothetical protein HPB48_005378 [Haemaphysalis longicornis]
MDSHSSMGLYGTLWRAFHLLLMLFFVFSFGGRVQEEKRKMEEKERKKAEVRKRLEEAAKAKKAGGKRGFMTPERKKKLRNLLRKKAAEELKKEQERKAEQRRKIIAERIGQPKPLDNCNEATLVGILKQYHARIAQLEDAKYDLEYEVRQKDFVVRPLVENGTRRTSLRFADDSTAPSHPQYNHRIENALGHILPRQYLTFENKTALKKLPATEMILTKGDFASNNEF